MFPEIKSSSNLQLVVAASLHVGLQKAVVDQGRHRKQLVEAKEHQLDLRVLGAGPEKFGEDEHDEQEDDAHCFREEGVRGVEESGPFRYFYRKRGEV